MNAAEIAQFYTLHPYKRMQLPEQAELCRAVLDAEAYRARVEGVAFEMRNEHPSHARVVEWAAQLTGDRND